MRLGRAAFASAWLLAAISVAVAAQAQASTEDAGTRWNAEALAVFETVCLGTLPGFDAAEARFAEAGLTPLENTLWVDNQRGLIAKTAHKDDGSRRACFLSMQQADLPALNAALGPAMGTALGVDKVSEIRAPYPGEPSLYLIERDGYRVTATVANVSQGYGVLMVTVDVPEGTTPPWSAE